MSSLVSTAGLAVLLVVTCQVYVAQTATHGSGQRAISGQRLRPQGPSRFEVNLGYNSPGNIVLRRHYRDGEKLTYDMKGVNESWSYEIQASGVVKKAADRKYFEEYGWSKLISGGAEIALPPASVNFRQQVSLDLGFSPSVPDLGSVSPMLIGPITDLLTFYSDLWLAMKSGSLVHEGDHFYKRYGTPASWADGKRVLVGQDSIDFAVTLSAVNRAEQTATVVVRHVPPKQPDIKLAADWMRTPVSDEANNWEQVTKNTNGIYSAEIGKETFDIEILVSLGDGKILSATLDNLVVARKRDCVDAELTRCGDPANHQITRKVEINLEH
jgi:hypothetical protein